MIICGDNKEIMAGIPDDSVDLIVTDPPYGWQFMGRDWDKAVPSVAIWCECLRVLKPGAFAFVMSGPRMDCLSEMGKRLGEAGFEIGFSPLFWTYASGFNKSGNMSILIDKRACRNELKAKLGRSPTKEEMREAWAKFRKVVGKSRHSANRKTNIGYGSDLSAEGERYLTLPATPEAQTLDGSYAGMQLKPATEIVIVAMKPLAHNTYIDQALDNGKGISWLDDGRIPYESDGEANEAARQRGGISLSYKQDGRNNPKPSGGIAGQPSGRFPANLLVSDDALNDGDIRQSGQPMRRIIEDKDSRSTYGSYQGGQYYHNGYGDSGSFSRFFSLDSWADEHLPDLPESVQRTFPFLIVPKASKREKNLGCEGLPEVTKGYGGKEYGMNANDFRPNGSRRKPVISRNYHPTVKPLKLMSYLITLGSRPGDLVLDPFAGTCTTAMAAKLLGRRWLMIEIGEEWCQIGRRRVEAVVPKLL